MEILENKITEMTEDLKNVEVGSMEYVRISNSIAQMTKANAEDKKAESEAKTAKTQKITNIIMAAAAIATPIVSVLGIVLKRKTNKDLMRYEDTDVMTSKAYDNR